MTSILDRSAVELRDAIASGEVKARDAVDASFNRARDVGAGRDRLNILLYQDRDHALARAAHCDAFTGTTTAPDRTLSHSIIPSLIDELPLLAVVGSQIEGGIQIRDAAELRHKESDRLATTAANLRAMGAEVEEFDDGLAVSGPTRLRGASVDSHGDHRIAMAFSVAALIADGETEIAGAECVAISFPEFFTLLESLAKR